MARYLGEEGLAGTVSQPASFMLLLGVFFFLSVVGVIFFFFLFFFVLHQISPTPGSCRGQVCAGFRPQPERLGDVFYLLRDLRDTTFSPI